MSKKYGYVYVTINTINDKKYIGKHVNNGRKYYGSGLLISQALKKYGRKNFLVEILEWCDSDEELYEKEELWIYYTNAVDSNDYYNLSHGGKGVLSGKKHHLYGKKHSKETRLKISKAHNGKIISEETREKNRLANIGEKNSMFGKHHSEEAKKKIGDAQKGKTISEEQKRKLSKVHKGNQYRLGKTILEEHKRKISEAQSGRKVSKETRKKLSEAAKGNQYWLGKKHSEETKKKMKLAWEKRKHGEVK